MCRGICSIETYRSHYRPFEQAASSLSSIACSSYPEKIQEAIDLLVERLAVGNKLLVCGNGGSAADAMHICAELLPRDL